MRDVKREGKPPGASASGETLLSLEGRGISSDTPLTKGPLQERSPPRERGLPPPFVAQEPELLAEWSEGLWELGKWPRHCCSPRALL